MDQSKLFTMIIDSKPVANVPVYYNNSVKELKTYINSLYPEKQLQYIYITPTSMLPDDDKIIIGSYWSQITQGYLVLSIRKEYYINNISYFEKFPKDVLYQIFLDMDHQDILNVCLSSKQFNDMICNSDKFWSLKLFHDYQFRSNEIGGEKNTKNFYPYAKYLVVPDQGLFRASSGGNKLAVDYFISKGARNFYIPAAMIYAAENGHEDIYDHLATLFPMTPDVYKTTVYSAIKGGNKNIIAKALKLSNYTQDDQKSPGGFPILSDMTKDLSRAILEQNMDVIKYIVGMNGGSKRERLYTVLGSAMNPSNEIILYFANLGITVKDANKWFSRRFD